jgi:hypothetical protein
MRGWYRCYQPVMIGVVALGFFLLSLVPIISGSLSFPRDRVYHTGQLHALVLAADLIWLNVFLLAFRYCMYILTLRIQVPEATLYQTTIGR